MAEFRAFDFSEMLSGWAAETASETPEPGKGGKQGDRPSGPSDNFQPFGPIGSEDQGGSESDTESGAQPESAQDQAEETQEQAAEDQAQDGETQGQDEEVQNDEASDSESGEALEVEGVLNAGHTEIQQEIQEPEAIPAEPPVPEGPGFVPGLLFGALAGIFLGAVVALIIAKTRKKKGFVPKNGKGSMKVVTLQGIGARENQQDALAASDPELYAEQGVLLCVADGMGGLKNGAMVSRTAVSTVMSKYSVLDKTDPDRMLAALVQSATSAVNMVLSPDYGTGGTTLLIGYAKNGLFYYASVGDSRICLYRDGKLIHLNRPHVFEDELLLRYINGEISYDSARTYEKRGALTSYLGMGKLKYADLPAYHIPMRSGDRFILMSDGVFNTLTDEEIGAAIQHAPKGITSVLNREIEKKQSRFQDNYSAVVLTVE